MKKFVWVILAFTACSSLFAQNDNKNDKHEVRAYYGEPLGMDLMNILSDGLTDALSGQTRSTSRVGLFGLGYRYKINRFKLGADLSYVGYKSDVKMSKNGTTDYKTSEHNFIVLPSADFVYYKRGILELYGGAGFGALFGTSKYTSVTDAGKKYLNNNLTDQSLSFAFHVAPIAIRLGNDRIGGFAELGYGMKGFVNVGLSFKF